MCSPVVKIKNNGGPWTIAKAEGQEKHMPVTQDELVSTRRPDSARHPHLLAPIVPHERLVNSFGLSPALVT